VILVDHVMLNIRFWRTTRKSNRVNFNWLSHCLGPY